MHAGAAFGEVFKCLFDSFFQCWLCIIFHALTPYTLKILLIAALLRHS